MQIDPRAYPHPVLAYWGDDIMNSMFQGVVTGKGAKNAYVFEAVFKTNNADLMTLVQQKENDVRRTCRMHFDALPEPDDSFYFHDDSRCKKVFGRVHRGGGR